MAAGVAVFFGETLEFGGKRSATPLWISPANGWYSVPASDPTRCRAALATALDLACLRMGFGTRIRS
ncbi:MAG TPA: hypothetical protein VIB00_03160, partial [Pyrinomonadaceae bacterium]